jgi:hypothetical protein
MVTKPSPLRDSSCHGGLDLVAAAASGEKWRQRFRNSERLSPGVAVADEMEDGLEGSLLVL